MTSPRWPVILFDLDGTLADSINLIVTSYQHAFREVVGHEWDETEIKSWIGRSLIDAFRTALGPELGERAYAEYTRFNEANTVRLMKGYDGVPQLLRDLTAAGVRTGVVTSKRRQPAEWAIELCGLDVPLLVGHEDVPAHKPDPRPLLRGLELLGADPQHAVYVGDAAVDVIAARNAGLPTVAVTWGAGLRADIEATEPLAMCDTVDELRAVLLG
ncbi:MAG: HAD family hydrolase [Propionibacteriaceae bacterium]